MSKQFCSEFKLKPKAMHFSCRSCLIDRFFIATLSVLAVLLMAGCQGHGGNTPAIDKVSSSPLESPYDLNSGAYRIGSGDKVNITVFGENDLTKDYVVNNIGYISFPLIGSLHVDGITLKQLEERIREKLMDGYLKNPSVSAQMAEFRPFYILGEVRIPGSYAFVSDMSVLNAVALAGGYTYRADQDIVEIMQGGNSKAKGGAVRRVDPETYSVRPGDIILVKERFF